MADPAVVDTVVLRYFLFVERAELLAALLQPPIYVPRIVFDPDEGDVPELAMSEVTRSILVQTRTAQDETRPSDARGEASLKAERLTQVHALYARGDLIVADLTDEELRVFAQLTATAGARALGLRFRIHPGEAACVAVGLARNHVVVTDDGDALKALEALRPGHPYERCRKLLGFRDTEPPFPVP